MAKDGNILIIDDDEGILATSRVVLRHHFKKLVCLTHPDLVSGLDDFASFDVVMLDMNFRPGATSGSEGMEALRKLLSINPGAHIVMITAYADIHLAVHAMKEGAVDFIVKPWDNERLLATVRSVFRLSKSRRKVQELEQKQKNLNQAINYHGGKLIGDSPCMKDLKNMIARVGQTDANILVLGENGSGKELVAREIHRLSHRSEKAFVAVDLGAIPESLFESELFGYVKGAFTDAAEDKAGRFEMADGGTLFLDEIGNLDLKLQSKLLSVLQNREVFRLGSNKAIPLDVRLLCATNMPLRTMVGDGRFREDLLYRINTLEINVPPLRDRIEDLPQLLDYFIAQYATRYAKNVKGVQAAALSRLKRYRWPGNIRELRHLSERAVILSEGTMLQSTDFALHEDVVHDAPPVLNLEKLEKTAIAAAIEKHQGNLSNAAKELGLGRTTLYRKMEKYGL